MAIPDMGPRSLAGAAVVENRDAAETSATAEGSAAIDN